MPTYGGATVLDRDESDGTYMFDCVMKDETKARLLRGFGSKVVQGRTKGKFDQTINNQWWSRQDAHFVGDYVRDKKCASRALNCVMA